MSRRPVSSLPRSILTHIRFSYRYRDFATELKRKGDRRLRDPEAASSVEEQERSIVEQTDALLLFVFSYVCLDRASAVAQAQGIGKEKIHSDQWKSMAPLLDYLKDRAHRKGLEVPWALWYARPLQTFSAPC